MTPATTAFEQTPTTPPVVFGPSERFQGGHRLSTELHVAESREHVFAFFADAFQLETITPPWLNFSVQTPKPIAMQRDTLIDYKLRVHGIPLRWRSAITRWEPPALFVDEQVKGPYRNWQHLHTFEETSTGTLIRDIVDYRVHFGRIVHPLFVRPDLKRIFAYRQEVLSEIFTPVAR